MFGNQVIVSLIGEQDKCGKLQLVKVLQVKAMQVDVLVSDSRCGVVRVCKKRVAHSGGVPADDDGGSSGPRARGC